MAMTTTTRRAMLGAISAAPILAVVPALAAPNGDAAILAAWEVRQAALPRILERGEYFDANHHSPELDDIHSDADVRIIEAEATTAAGALVQTWVAWSYQATEWTAEDKRIGAMIRRADLAALEAEERDLDYNHRAMLHLVRSLRNLVGVA